MSHSRLQRNLCPLQLFHRAIEQPVLARGGGPTPGGGVFLAGVAAMSARSLWVVGATGSGDGPRKTLVLRWTGAGWKKVPSPSPRASAQLFGVAVTSARNAWAVGFTSNSNHGGVQTLIEHWNGASWR
jgi:hypothetical protein